MNPPIPAKELEIHVISGDPKDDPYGQGFTSMTAKFLLTDPSAMERLKVAGKSLITLRCARFVISGSVLETDGKKGSMSVMNLDLRPMDPKPKITV